MPRDLDNLDPSLLAELDFEADFAKSTQRRKFMPRISIEKNTSMLIRFLPVEIGTTKHWLGRYAQHWVHKRAIFCRKMTAPNLGGDPSYKCPICALVENGMAHNIESVKLRAEECAAGPKWFGVVLPLARDTGKGKPTAIAAPECQTAHEFSMWRTMFDQLRLIAARFAIKGTQGIVDIHTGQDVWVQRTLRGYTMTPGGQNALYEQGEDPQSVIDTIWSTVVIPEVKMPDQTQEAEFFHKIKEYITTGGGSFDAVNQNSRGRGGPAPAQTDLDEDGLIAQPQVTFNRGGRNIMAPPSAPADTVSDDLDQGVEAPMPPQPATRPTPPRAPQVAPPPIIQQPQVVVQQPVIQQPQVVVQQPVIQQPVVQQAPVVTSPRVVAPAASKLVAPPSRPSSTIMAPPVQQQVPQPVQVTQPAQVVQQLVPIQGGTAEDEDDGVAPESTDSAPPIVDAELTGQPATAQSSQVTPTQQVAEQPAPPKVKASGTRLGAGITARLSSFQQK